MNFMLFEILSSCPVKTFIPARMKPWVPFGLGSLSQDRAGKLLTQAELGDEFFIAFGFAAGKVLQQAVTLTDHLQQATP